MNASAKKFFKEILEAPSPSGFEQPVQEIVRRYASDFADQVRTDLHGNVIACCNPDAPLRVMIAGHADQIGLIVSHINENGYIYTNTIGGWDPQQLIGQRMTIYTAAGPVPAVIARKPIHLLDQDERKQVVKQKELWLDIGAKDKEEAAAAVAIGDPVTLELGYQEMRNSLANAPGMDDKTGLWVAMEALRRAKKRGGLKVGLFAVATVQEEIGLRGAVTSAYGVHPHVGIAVDVTHATDCPTIDKTQEGDIKL
ncbi:MAG: M42 family peptidase, partial [Pirellulales bacterium]|nr:M42 family peptidase [Pirellulales bacterium]